MKTQTRKIQFKNANGCPLENAYVETKYGTATTDAKGFANVRVSSETDTISVSTYEGTKEFTISELTGSTEAQPESNPETNYFLEIPETPKPQPETQPSIKKGGIIEKHWGKMLAAGVGLFVMSNTENSN